MAVGERGVGMMEDVKVVATGTADSEVRRGAPKVAAAPEV